MFTAYKELPIHPLSRGVTFHLPQEDSQHITEDHPAATAMTDFKKIKIVTAFPEEYIEKVHERMIQRGIRLLVVVDSSHSVVGIITAADILGEKSMKAARDRNTVRKDLMVSDVMTTIDHINVLTMEDVNHAKVGNIVSTLRKISSQHILVVEKEGNHTVLRGLFSSTQIARQLGMAMETYVRAVHLSEAAPH